MRIPLFPLNTVLFPGASLSLHIFEPRYRLMVSRCTERDEPFGVALIAAGQEVGGPARPRNIGTTARIVHVQPQPDGRLNIMTVGGQRFRILDTDTAEPYLTGEVELLWDEDEDALGTDEAAAHVGELFTEYARISLAINDEWTRTIPLPKRHGTMADFVAAKMAVDNAIKQQLLEELSVPRRLSLARRILEPGIEIARARLDEAHRVKWGAFGVFN